MVLINRRTYLFASMAVLGLLCLQMRFGFAQKPQTKIVSAKYTYVAGKNVTTEEAQRVALECAQIQAIADEFGTIILQSNTTYVENNSSGGDASSKIQMISLGSSDVRGEWIETTIEPNYKIEYDKELGMVVSVTLQGKIREIITAPLNLTTKILRNGITEKFENSSFRNGDDMYLLFQSPVAGYLTVYLTDADNAYCLLPYQNQNIGSTRIEANQEYVFFSIDAAENAIRHLVDEYNLTCGSSLEVNRLYIIFSPNEYTKAVDQNGDGILPRNLTLKDFQKWLSKARSYDTKMVLQAVDLDIRP